MLGIIGGTGLADALFGQVDGTDHVIETPFGAPSGPVRVVHWQGLEVALLARHGAGHLLNPSQVPYRANIYAMKSLGVTHLIASGAVGSLREEFRPRELVIVDQVIDRTYRRVPTFFDAAGGTRNSLNRFAPCCGSGFWLRPRRSKPAVHPHGTYICMEGPAFSSQAESQCTGRAAT